MRPPDRVWLLAEPVGGHSIGSEIHVERPAAVVSPDGLGALVQVDSAWARAEAVELADAPTYAARRKRELGVGRAVALETPVPDDLRERLERPGRAVACLLYTSPSPRD
eukprot:5434-Alexandrium_andersonii.AAC.1